MSKVKNTGNIQNYLKIKSETKQLQDNNDALATKISETHIYEAYCQELKRINDQLQSNSYDVTLHANAEKDLEALYNGEISKLKKILAEAKLEEKALNDEYHVAHREYEETNKLATEARRKVEVMQRQTEKARYEADEKHKLYTSLQHEVEELRGIRSFNETLHKTEIENLQHMINRCSWCVDQNTFLPTTQRIEEINIDELLYSFKKEYEEILSKFNKEERDALLSNIHMLETKNKDADLRLRSQQHEIAEFEKEIKKLTVELASLQNEAEKYEKLAKEENLAYERERGNLNAEIRRLEKEKSMKQQEWEELIEKDNQATNLIIQLQLEIKAYQALLDAEPKYKTVRTTVGRSKHSHEWSNADTLDMSLANSSYSHV